MKVEIHIQKMIVDLVNSLKNQSFEKSVFLRITYYSLEDLMHQHFSNKQKVGKVEGNRLRIGKIGITWTRVDFQESVKFGEKLMEVYERIVNEEKFKNPFQKLCWKSVQIKKN